MQRIRTEPLRSQCQPFTETSYQAGCWCTPQNLSKQTVSQLFESACPQRQHIPLDHMEGIQGCNFAARWRQALVLVRWRCPSHQ